MVVVTEPKLYARENRITMADNLLDGLSDPSQSEVAPYVLRPKDEFDRSRFATELANNPALLRHLMAISAGENLDPTSNRAVLETTMNRAAMMGTPLAQEARTTGQGGYYAGYNPHALYDPTTRAMIESNLDAALHGSNVSNYATDNSSGVFAAHRAAIGMYTPTGAPINGEWFTVPTRPDARGYAQYAAWRANLPTNQFTESATPEDRLTEAMRNPLVPSYAPAASHEMLASAIHQALGHGGAPPISDLDRLALVSMFQQQMQPTQPKRLPNGMVDFSGTSQNNTGNLLALMMRGRQAQNMLDAIRPQEDKDDKK